MVPYRRKPKALGFPLLRTFPFRYRVSFGQLEQELTADLFVKEIMNKLIGPVHDVNHKRPHLRIINARQLAPRNLAGRCTDDDIRVVPALGVRNHTGVQIFQNGIAKTP